MELNQNRTDYTALEGIAELIRKSDLNDIDDVYYLIDYVIHEVHQTGRDCGNYDPNKSIFSLF